MSKFVLSFRVAEDHNPEADPDNLTDWLQFLTEAIDPVVVDPGWPVFEPPVVVGEGGPSTRLGGYAVIEVDTIESAVSIAERCPTVSRGGGVEVGTLADLPAEHPAEVMRARLAK